MYISLHFFSNLYTLKHAYSGITRVKQPGQPLWTLPGRKGKLKKQNKTASATATQLPLRSCIAVATRSCAVCMGAGQPRQLAMSLHLCMLMAVANHQSFMQVRI